MNLGVMLRADAVEGKGQLSFEAKSNLVKGDLPKASIKTTSGYFTQLEHSRNSRLLFVA